MKITHLRDEWFLIGEQIQEKFGDHWFNVRTDKGTFTPDSELLEQAQNVYNCRRKKT